MDEAANTSVSGRSHSPPGAPYLNLIHMRRPHLTNLLDLFDVLYAIVADADALRFTLLVHPLQGQPHLLPRGLARIRAVNQEQIHVPRLRIQLLDALDTLGIAPLYRPSSGEDLGGQKDVLARNPRLLDSKADLGLIGVELRRIDMSISALQSGETRLHTHVCWGLVDAEAQLRYFRGVWQRESAVDADIRHGGDLYLELFKKKPHNSMTQCVEIQYLGCMGRKKVKVGRSR